MFHKPDFETTRKYWQAFWEQELIDRPLISVIAPKKGVAPSAFSTKITDCFNACMSGDFDSYLKGFDEYLSTLYFGGEALPNLELTLGPDQYAAFLGGTLEAPQGAITTWSHPIVDDFSKFEVKIDKSPGSYFDNLKKFFRRAAQFSKDRFLLCTPDLHSNLDALSALRGPEDLCIDIMDCPEEVHRVLNEVRATYDEIFTMPYIAGDLINQGSTSWAPLFADKGEKYAVVQCDFSCLLSPAQAREFAIPAIAEEAAYLDKNVYHYDGVGALGHMDDVLAIEEIDVIQWLPGTPDSSVNWMDLLKKIQKAGKSLWVSDWTAQDIKAHFKELEPNKVFFSVWTSSQDEADELIEYIHKNM